MNRIIIFLLISFSVFSHGGVETKDAFIRLLPASAPNTGGFITLINTSKKNIKLVKAQSDLAKSVELHDHIKVKDMMEMREVDSILIKAGSTVKLEPGSLHIMFMGLKRKLVEGKKEKVKLFFSDSSNLEILFPVLNK